MNKKINHLIQEFVRSLIFENVKDAVYDNNTDLLQAGLVDSLFVIDLIQFLEINILGREISLKKYSRNDFNTINKCINIVNSELAS